MKKIEFTIDWILDTFIETYGFNDGIFSLSFIDSNENESIRYLFVKKALDELGIDYHYIELEDEEIETNTFIWNIAAIDMVKCKDEIPSIYKKFVEEAEKDSKTPLN